MMNYRFFRDICLAVAAAMLASQAVAAGGRSENLLYDPEPPVDSAYVRVIHVGHESALDVLVDGKPRIPNLASGEVSDYLVLPMGKHTIALQTSGKSTASASATLEVESGRALTVAFTPSGTRPLVFEDKANSNKLKAVLAVYRLDAKPGTLDVLSADGKVRVFSNVASGTSSQLSVNPITIELIAAKSGEKTAQARTTLSMAPGGTYSILLLPGEKGKLIARSAQNRVERYTGK